MIQVISNHEGMALEELSDKSGASYQEEGFSLYDSDRSLKRIFGKKYGLSVGYRKDGQAGYMVSFRLPQKKEG